MCNVTIAKAKLQNLKVRTEKDLYGLEFDSMDFMPLTEETYFKVKMICNDNNLLCPLYKYGGEIKFRESDGTVFSVLRILAKEHDIYLDYTKIPH